MSAETESQPPVKLTSSVDEKAPTPPLAIPDDAELARRAAAGDGRAFHVLVDRHGQRLFRMAVSLVGTANDAEDVLQEALAGAYRNLRTFEGRSSFKTWLTRILITQAAKWRRDRRRIRRHGPMMAIDAVPEPSAAHPDPGEAAGRKMDVLAALKLLTEEHREVLVLREFDGLAYEEIAEVLGVPRGTVESRLHRARAEMKEKLKGYLS
jgi:RNA polymerase sigma-70 factor (ECF subfamily)